MIYKLWLDKIQLVKNWWRFEKSSTVVVSVGGGGLCAEVIVVIESLISNCRIIALNWVLFPNTYIKNQKEKNRKIDPLAETKSLTAKKPLDDGIAVKIPESMTFLYISKYVDEFDDVS